MKSITNLRDELSALFDQIKTGAIDVKQAAEMNNTAGKIINTVKVQLEYAALRKEAPDIPFMQDKADGSDS